MKRMRDVAEGTPPWELDADAVAAALETDPELGLSEAVAARRLQEDGPNELRSVPPVPTWKKRLAQLNDPLIWLLLAVAISVAAWLLEGRHGGPVDAVVIAVVVRSDRRGGP